MKCICILLLSCFMQLAHANDIAFVVYHVKGNSQKTNNKQPLKKGDQLFAKDVLLLTGAAELVLICNNYKIIQLKKTGKYAVTGLLQQCNKTSASYSSTYFKYVWNELTKIKGTPEKRPGDFMKNVGAVSRGCADVIFGIATDTLHVSPNSSLFIHFKTFYSNASAAIYPEQYDGAALNKIAVKNVDSLQIQSLTKSLSPGMYYWQVVEADGSSCERNYIKVWNKKEYIKMISFLLKDVPYSTPAETAFAKGFLLQENKFTAEAFIWYKNAVALDPSNSIYQQSLSTFYETKL